MESIGDSQIREAIAAGYVPDEFSFDFLRENITVPATVGIVFVTVLTSLVVTCRLLTRKLIVKRFGLGVDDWIALSSLSCSGWEAPDQMHSENVLSYAQFARFMVVDSIAHMTYSTALILCRVSALAFYFRICRLHKEFLLAIKIVFCILIAGYLAQMLLIIFHCRPVTLLWVAMSAADAEKYVCLEWDTVYLTSSIISLVCDFMVFGVPVAMIWVLDMTRKRKIQLACILLPGIAVFGLSIVRLLLVSTNDAFKAAKFGFAYIIIVEVAEIGATLIALSIPGVKPLVDKYIFRNKDETNRGAQARNRKAVDSFDSASARSFWRGSASDVDCEYYDAKTQAMDPRPASQQEGIRVKVDVDVSFEDGDDKLRWQGFF